MKNVVSFYYKFLRTHQARGACYHFGTGIPLWIPLLLLLLSSLLLLLILILLLLSSLLLSLLLLSHYGSPLW